MFAEEILLQIGALESSLADLYQWYSEILASDSEVSRVFSMMSEEEKTHASLVEYSRRLVRSDLAFSSEVEFEVAGIKAVLEKVLALRKTPVPPTADQAIQLTLWLEMTTADDHSRNRTSLKKGNPGLARLLKALASEDLVHFGRVMELARRRGIRVPASAGDSPDGEPLSIP